VQAEAEKLAGAGAWEVRVPSSDDAETETEGESGRAGGRKWTETEGAGDEMDGEELFSTPQKAAAWEHGAPRSAPALRPPAARAEGGVRAQGWGSGA
jgi:hypothetical protein